jgi:hypothetical protein
MIQLGQKVEARVEAYPGKTFSGKVEFIQPHLDPSTRTVEVRYAIDNPGHKLRPGMFATARLETSIGQSPEIKTRFAGKLSSTGKLTLASMTAEEQKICPVTDAELGTMGEPIAVDVEGGKLWTCCDACPPKVKASPALFTAKLASYRSRLEVDSDVPRTAEQQKTCPVTSAKLGSMGEPVPVELDGRMVWTCCNACPPKLEANPEKYLARIESLTSEQILSVPEMAVIDTGLRKIVYVESEPGVFEAREVVLGPSVGDRYPVLEGLLAGEKVASAGAFLIDAESRINPKATPKVGVARGSAPRIRDSERRAGTGHDHSQDAFAPALPAENQP